jgi:ATP-binding cassette, subfamily C (CFTR/MRP), member 1
VVYLLCRIRPFIITHLDLWELPQPRHTDTITANIERNFYSRCPPNKRPAFMHRLSSDTPLSDSELGKTGSVNAISEEKDEKPGNNKPEQSTTKSDEKYDESFFKALHRTFFKRIWFSAVLLVVSGK